MIFLFLMMPYRIPPVHQGSNGLPSPGGGERRSCQDLWWAHASLWEFPLANSPRHL